MQRYVFVFLLSLLFVSCAYSPVIVRKVYSPKKMVTISYVAEGFESSIAKARAATMEKAEEYCQGKTSIVSEEMKTEIEGVSTDSFGNTVSVDKTRFMHVTFECLK